MNHADQILRRAAAEAMFEMQSGFMNSGMLSGGSDRAYELLLKAVREAVVVGPCMIFYRGCEEYRRLPLVGNPEDIYRIRHTQPFRFEPSESPDRAAEMVTWVEDFILVPHGKNGPCPNCETATYSSTNYHLAPDWLYRQERDQASMVRRQL